MKKVPKITPRGKYILVKLDKEASRTSEYGIRTPDNVEQEKKSVGEVIDVGPEIKDVKKGDTVMYGTFAGDDIAFDVEDGKTIEFKILHDEDVLANLEY